MQIITTLILKIELIAILLNTTNINLLWKRYSWPNIISTKLYFNLNTCTKILPILFKMHSLKFSYNFINQTFVFITKTLI